MRKIALASLVTALIALPGHAFAATDKGTGEEQLAKLLAGRVAGKPVDCIGILDAEHSQVIDRTAIVFGTGSTIYVNRPKYPENLTSDDILITKSWIDELCQVDTVQLRDRFTFIYVGFVDLGQFVPYTFAPKSATLPPASGKVP